MKKKTFKLVLHNVEFTCHLDLKHRKNLNIRIKPNNIINISKPSYISQNKLEAYLKTNEESIYNKAVEINKIHQRRNNFIFDNFVVIFDQEVLIKDNILDNLDNILLDYLEEIRSEFDKLIDVDVTILVSKLTNKWGVAYIKDNLIKINSNLVHYPKSVIKYVLLHEYMHFIEANHSKRFYKLIEDVMPDYKEKIKYLKSN